MRFKAIYDDRLRWLSSLGPTEVKRASHVEPQGLQWIADMGPEDGPVLGPFDTRAEALQREREWLLKKWKGELSISGQPSPSGGQSSDP